MTQVKTWSFRDHCHSFQNATHDSNLGRNIVRIEDVDFWRLYERDFNLLGRPLHTMAVGSKLVTHFHVQKHEQDIFIEISHAAFESLQQHLKSVVVP